MKTLHQGDILPQSAARTVDVSDTQDHLQLIAFDEQMQLAAYDEQLQDFSEQYRTVTLGNKVSLFAGRVMLNMDKQSGCTAFQSEALGFRRVTGDISGEPATRIPYSTFDMSGAVHVDIATPANVLVVPATYDQLNATVAELADMPHPQNIAKSHKLAKPCDERTGLVELAELAYKNNGYETTIGYDPRTEPRQGVIRVVHALSSSVVDLAMLKK